MPWPEDEGRGTRGKKDQAGSCVRTEEYVDEMLAISGHTTPNSLRCKRRNRLLLASMPGDSEPDGKQFLSREILEMRLT